MVVFAGAGVIVRRCAGTGTDDVCDDGTEVCDDNVEFSGLLSASRDFLSYDEYKLEFFSSFIYLLLLFFLGNEESSFDFSVYFIVRSKFVCFCVVGASFNEIALRREL